MKSSPPCVLQKAFTIILLSTIVIWVLTHFSFDWKFLTDENIDMSILAGIAKLFQPLLTPLGFGSQLGDKGWIFAVAIVTGLIAKENVVATFSTLGGIGAMIVATNISTPALLSFIAFNMLTVPCMAAVATAKAEISDKRKFNFTILFWVVTSYIVSTAIFTIGSYIWTLAIWGTAFVALIVTMVLLKSKKNNKEKK